jgi:hypothetical protein
MTTAPPLCLPCATRAIFIRLGLVRVMASTIDGWEVWGRANLSTFLYVVTTGENREVFSVTAMPYNFAEFDANFDLTEPDLFTWLTSLVSHNLSTQLACCLY